MKVTLLRMLVACTFAALCGTANSAIVTASASLDYAQEVAPSNTTPSSATGTATLLFDVGTGLLDLTAEVSGISLADVSFPSGPLAFGTAGPFHIHQAAAGANGPIVVPFNAESFFSETADGLLITAFAIPFDAALIAPLVAGDLYLNLHTLDYASGEIRGQLAVPEPAATALLSLGVLGLAFFRRRYA